jgi:hypothetical protein
MNYAMAGDNIGSFATQSTRTDSLLAMNEPRIGAPIQEQPAPSFYSAPVYTSSQDCNSTMPQLLPTFPSSSDNLYWTGPELIESQAGQDFGALDETCHFIDQGIHNSIAVLDAGDLDLANLVPGGDDQCQDDFNPPSGGNGQGPSKN